MFHHETEPCSDTILSLNVGGGASTTTSLPPSSLYLAAHMKTKQVTRPITTSFKQTYKIPKP
jgi:hypothetical protein